MDPFLSNDFHLRRRNLWQIGALSLSVLIPGSLWSQELFDETKAKTLFAFDDVSIPYTQNLRLEMIPPEKFPANPVLKRGGAKTVDAMGVQFYGSILREGDRYRMWYVAQDDDTANPVASARWRVAYAESPDGVRWTKPDLGLVEYRGNAHNSLVRIDPSPLGIINVKVLCDDADPEPGRRYKMTAHVYFRHQSRLGTLATFVSPDGYRWKMVREVTPVQAELAMRDVLLPPFHFEPCGGFYRWQKMFYISGQNAMSATRPYQGRITRMYRSSDFDTWSSTSSIGFIRATQHEYLGSGRSLEGEQNHEGISVWERRNVLLGVYGRWHGAKEWSDITVDLGFVLSNDGVHFREPAHEWTLLQHGADGEWDQGGLLQGQGFENIGSKTYLYYGAWDPRKPGQPRGGVGIATLERDRFAALMVDERAKGNGDYQQPEIQSELVTKRFRLNSPTPRLFVNADGLGDEAWIKVSLLDDRERPLPGFSGADAAIVRQGGFQVPIAWKNARLGGSIPKKIAIHLAFEGTQASNIRMYAIYLQESEDR